MLLDFALPEHDRKLIPEGRVSGPMPWVIAIMVFLTLLAAATALLLGNAASRGGEDLARQATVQIIEADPSVRAANQRRVIALLQRTPGVQKASAVPDADVRELLEPWLGSGVADADIPIPALIDVRFTNNASTERLAAIDKSLSAVANVRIDSNASWMAPFFELMRALILLAIGILLLLLAATGATVVLAVRSALNTHRETIEIMHMMGSTDIQAARLFERRVALDALLGGLIGFAAAVLTIALLGGRFAAIEPGLLGNAGMPWYGWIILALIPLAVMGLAMLIARLTVTAALKKML